MKSMSSLRTGAPKPAAEGGRRRRAAARREAASHEIHSASKRAKELAAEIRTSLSHNDLEILTPEALQALFAATCRLYSAQLETGGQHLPLGARDGVTATDVMNSASGMLKAVNLAVFELGMWQSWTGR